jgi:hypothetical protein
MEETTKNIKYIIEDSDLTVQETKNVINTLIDNRINMYKINYLKAWEKDHSISSEDLNKTVAQLNQRRKELIEEIESQKSSEKTVSINTSFGLDFAELKQTKQN